jgi:hypothetical protein
VSGRALLDPVGLRLFYDPVVVVRLFDDLAVVAVVSCLVVSCFFGYDAVSRLAGRLDPVGVRYPSLSCQQPTSPYQVFSTLPVSVSAI